MSTEKLKFVLKQNNYKVTGTRLAVLDIFSKVKKPINADFILRRLKKFNVDRVTIYRTLKSFQKSGILKKVSLQKEADYYEVTDDHHHHIVCNNCGQIEDFKSGEIEKAAARIAAASSKFKKITDHSFEIFGVCKSCVRV